MRQRILKPSFFTNEDLARLAPLIRIAFLGTWGEADRDGRLEDRPDRLKVLILPYDRIDMDAALQQLHDAGFITRYQAEDRRFIQVNAFRAHQNPHPKEPSLHIPPAPSLTSVPRTAIAGNGNKRQAVNFSPGSSLTGSTGSTDPPLPPRAPNGGAPRSLLLAELTTFWQAYPGGRTAKRKAEEKFIKARKSGVTLQVMLDALARQVEARAQKTARAEWVPEWCNAATWLHNRRWEDEVAPPPQAVPGTISREEWLLRLRDMRDRNRPAFLHAVRGRPQAEIEALEHELDALPTPATRQEAS